MNHLIPNKQCLLLFFNIKFLYLFSLPSFLKLFFLSQEYTLKLEFILLSYMHCSAITRFHYVYVHIFNNI